MLFAMIWRDGPEGKEKRRLYREGHIERLEKLEREGRLVLAGPFADGSGSLIVFEADSAEDATAFAAGDPYVREGVFESHEVRPFKQVFPK
ncbi:MAG: YciI family protein [Thermodesulfobacteriota bacterium]